jgi:hypothetical protein
MSKFSKRKIAVTMAFASLFGGKTSAAQTDKIPQTVAAVGGALLVTINPLNRGLPRIKNWE